jgi:hypothetical protein
VNVAIGVGVPVTGTGVFVAVLLGLGVSVAVATGHGLVCIEAILIEPALIACICMVIRLLTRNPGNCI